jgi:hypothetical protein
VRNGFRWPCRALLCAAAAILPISCAAPGTPEPTAQAPAGAPKPAAAAAPATSRLRQEDPPAALGTVERYAWLAVVNLGEAYQEGNVEGFLNRVSRGFYRGYPALETALRADLDGTAARRVVVAVAGVTTEGDRVSVRARWERSLARGDGTPRSSAGETVFLFLRSETSLRLLDFRGDPPFGIEGIPEHP